MRSMLFDHAMALMREHVKPTARIHRVIQEGGVVANVIPDHTRAEYWVRDASDQSVQELLARMRKAADGAAMATETRAQVKLLFSVRDVVDNPALDAVVQKELERVGPPGLRRPGHRVRPGDAEGARGRARGHGHRR